MELKSYESTIQDLSAALKLKPKDPFILYQRGLCFYQEGNYPKALSNLSKSLRFDPDVSYIADVYYHQALGNAWMGNYADCLLPLTQAIAVNPFEAVYYHERAKANLMTDQFDQAINDYDVVIRIQPNNAHAFFGRGFAYKNIRDYSQASDDFEIAKDLDPREPRFVLNYKKVYGLKFVTMCCPGEEQK